MHTERSIGKLETAVESLTSASSKHSMKLDELNKTISTAQGVLKTIAWIGGVAGAIGVTLLGAIFKTLADHFAKH